MNKKNYLKYSFIIIALIVTSFFLSNLFLSYLQNKIVSFLNSNKFDYFIMQRIDQKLEKLSEGELTKKEIDYYSRIYKKVKKKFDPVFNNK